MPKLVPIDRPGVPPLAISPRLQSQLVYFAAPPGGDGVPPLGEQEYWFRPEEVAAFLDDGVISLVSPLDTDNKTDVEISDEQEALLDWLKARAVRHVRVVD